jgi:hypothetical protein
MTVHAFVDETKRHGLVLAAAVVIPRDLASTRNVMRQLCLPRQSRVHFKKESNSRRGAIVAAIRSTAVTVNIYDGTTLRSEAEARAACLRQIVLDLNAVGAHRLVIEQEDSMLLTDRAVLYTTVRGVGAQDTLTYEHLRPHAEPLLWIADAVAWCWTHGSSWREQIASVVGTEWKA